jgi:hypothetical protein
MPKLSKSLLTDTDFAPPAVAVAIEQGDPATDLIVVLTGAVKNSLTAPGSSMTSWKPATCSSRYP